MSLMRSAFPDCEAALESLAHANAQDRLWCVYKLWGLGQLVDHSANGASKVNSVRLSLRSVASGAYHVGTSSYASFLQLAMETYHKAYSPTPPD